MDLSLSEKLRASIRERWAVVDHAKFWPWLKKPCEVRVLLYAEGSVRFDGGPFYGLQHVISTLNADPWYWVKFKVTTAHRGTDPSADLQNKTLDALDLNNNYDQIWLFGISSGNQLSGTEVTAINNFMSTHKGGVLVTGDHASLGQGITGAIPRAGKMRQYPAPDAFPPGWNTTLVEGSDADTTYDFVEQSDDIPQSIRLRRYPLWSPIKPFWLRRWAPHPVLCGPDGPIDVLPDHQHEGEAVVPPNFPAAEWPSKDGYQPKPEVIAWGRVKDPAASKHGQEIGVISAYDGHRADVGRITADSTWHHWFDINLTGVPGNPSYSGFPMSAAGLNALKKIEAYFLNTAVWLAPPAKQVCMRNALFWGLLWSERFIEYDVRELKVRPDILIFLGEEALDALGRRAPQCTVRQWIFDDLIAIETVRWFEEIVQRSPRFPIGPDVFLTGAVFHRLLMEFGRSDARAAPPKAPADKTLNALIGATVGEGIDAMRRYYTELNELAAEMIKVHKQAAPAREAAELCE